MAFDSEKYTHDADRAALKALKAIPGFSALLKAFMGVWNERQQKILNMSSRIRISERQMRKYHDMLPPICEKLGIPVPELYLEMNVVPNAYTSGDNEPFIVVTSGLLKAVPEELIPTVLAHECGHIACRHVLYLTMGRIVLQGAGSVLSSTLRFGSLLTVPLQIAFYYWMRCSEFSADRAAVLCDGTDRKMQEVCLRLAGWDQGIDAEASLDAFLDQASGYQDLIGESKWNKAMEFMILNQASHPLMAVRATECRNWYASENCRALLGVASPSVYRLSAAPLALEGADPAGGEADAGDSGPESLPEQEIRPRICPVVLPEEYKQLPSKPTDPKDSTVYGHVGTQSDAFIQITPVAPEDTMCFDAKEAVIEKVRNALADGEGLISVDCGTTAHGKKYAYSLIKTLHEPRSIEYRLTLHFAEEDSAVSIQAFFMEIGMPGFREAAVKGQMKRELQGIPESDLQAAWSRDPYDPSWSKGLLMNESEKSKYDFRFPLHPLTEARRFAASLIAKN